MRRTLLVLLLIAAPLAYGDDAGSLALLVRDSDVDVQRVSAALGDDTPLMRATAARLANVRDLRAVVPALRKALAAERNAEVAREQIRALIMLGDDEDVAHAVKESQRFPAGIDAAVSDAIGRLGGTRALDLHLKHRSSLRQADAAVTQMLWGRPQLVNIAAAKLLGAADGAGWSALLSAAEEAAIAVDPQIVAAALRSDLPDARNAALWYVVRAYAEEPSRIPPAVLEAIDGKLEAGDANEAVALELIGRMRGREPNERAEWTAWMRSPRAAHHWRQEPLVRLLTPGELKAIDVPAAGPRSPRSGKTQPLPPAPFHLPAVLPAGLAESVIAASDCGREQWIGVGGATAGADGRVAAVRVGNVQTSAACRRAIETLFRLSLVSPDSIVSPLSTDQILLVRPVRGRPCLDEAAVEAVQSATFRAGAGAGGDIKPPKVVKRVEPQFPERARQMLGGANAIVVIESVISREGCVRSIQLVQQTPYAELNGAAVTAISQWKFEPGRLDGQPVDVIFNLTFNFKPR